MCHISQPAAWGCCAVVILCLGTHDSWRSASGLLHASALHWVLATMMSPMPAVLLMLAVILHMANLSLVIEAVLSHNPLREQCSASLQVSMWWCLPGMEISTKQCPLLSTAAPAHMPICACYMQKLDSRNKIVYILYALPCGPACQDVPVATPNGTLLLFWRCCFFTSVSACCADQLGGHVVP